MKIKGAFSVRWAAQNGKNGTGVTIVKTEVKYAVTTNTTRPTSGWSTTLPTSISDGNYLWTWTHVEYSDGTSTDAYSVARQGVDGKGIRSSVATYSLQATNVNPESISNWGSFPSTLTDGYWLYTRTVITYSEGDTTTSYSVSQVGTGSYYAGVEEYYKAGASATVAPDGAATAGTYTEGQSISTSWTQERPTLSTSTPYLWNFEVSSDSRGNRYVTAARCIGNFAKGIVSIVETYAISAQGTVPSGRDYPSDIGNSDWKDEHQASAPTNEKPYQWNRTVTTYNNGDTDTTYHVSAVKGIDGKGSVYIDLDNENDTILYDGAGNKISGNSVSNIKLYDNGSDVTSGKTFSIDSRSSNVTASISGSVLTCSGIVSSDGYVIVKCVYNGVSYYARYTVKRLQGTDKYDLEVTPNSITYNTDSGTGNSTISVKIYKTAQNGSRSMLTALPSNFTLKYIADTDTAQAISYGSTGGTFTPNTSKSRYRIELRDASSNLLDYETVPIAKVKNGDQGDSGSNVIVADTYKRSFTTSQWDTYGESGHSENWIEIKNYSSFKVGDTIIILGTDTDKNVEVQLHATVTAIGSPSTTNGVTSATITATSFSLIVGGSMADYYELLPSLNEITFTKTADGKGLTPSSRTLTVKCMHVTPSQRVPVSIPSGYSVRYNIQTTTSATATFPSTSSAGSSFPSSGLTITSGTIYTMILLSLFKGSVLVDMKSVPVIKGGVDGADNIGVTINLDNDMTSFPLTNAGRPQSQTVHSNHVSIYAGNALEDLTDLTVTCSDSRCTVVKTTSNGVYNGDFKVTIPTLTSSPYYFTSDKILVTIVAKSASCTEGKTIIWTLSGIRGGLNAVLYELMPSLNTISFARDSSDNLTPSSVTITCGYQKNDGGTITNYDGSTVANLWVDGGAPYNMMYRYQKADGTYTNYDWCKNLSNCALTINSSTSYIAVEYVLTSSSSYATVTDANIIDREVIPIVKGGSKGSTGTSATSYWLVPSVEEILRYQSGELSVSKVTCDKMKKTGSTTAVTASDVTLYYKYKELGVDSSETSYPSAGITVGLWWSEIVIIGKAGGVEVARSTVYVKEQAVAVGANIINGTNFEDAKDSGTVYTDDNVVSDCVDGVKGIKSTSFSKTTASYKDFFRTIVNKTDDVRLLPSTWYTFSFWAKADTHYQALKNETKALYGFATETTFFTKGTHIIDIYGQISSAAVSAGFELRVYVYKEDWSWSTSTATSSTSATHLYLTCSIPSTGEYKISAYVYKSGTSTISDSSWTATIYYYNIFSQCVRSHVYPSAIDTSYVQVVDGESNPNGTPSDGNVSFALSSAWKRYVHTFRTKSSISTSDVQRVLFRHIGGTASVYICKIKLEKGIAATDWGRSEKDKGGLEGLIMRVTEWAAGVDYHNDEDVNVLPRYLDVVVTGSGTSTAKRFMCKKTHLSESSNTNGKGEPTATNSYWTELNNTFPIYTPLLLADNAIIRFTQTNQILVENSAGNIIAGMAGRSNFPLFVGANQNNPSAAPFRVSTAGELFSTSGNIGGLKINADKLSDTSGKTSISVGSEGIRFNGTIQHSTGKSGVFSDVDLFTLPAKTSLTTISMGHEKEDIGKRCLLTNSSTFGSNGYYRVAVQEFGFNGLNTYCGDTDLYLIAPGETVEMTCFELAKSTIQIGTDSYSITSGGMWKITNRFNREIPRVVAMGKVTNSTTYPYATIEGWTICGNTLSVSRTNAGDTNGTYTITLPSYFSKCSAMLVMATGVGVSQGSSTPIKATVISHSRRTIVVRTSDDSSDNAGSFNFVCYDTGGWNL